MRRPRSRVRGRLARRLALAAPVLALLLVAIAVAPAVAQDRGQVRAGRAFFEQACATCHGQDARGVAQRGPTLRGAGALSADFYLSTGRMPLADPRAEPNRAPPAYSRRARRALVAYVASLGGPPVPRVDPRDGDPAEGRRLFATNCSGCHQIAARGGIVAPDGVAPGLQDATARQIAQAIRIGPYTMPPFSEQALSDREVASIARFVLATRHPVDRGGWGIGHIGPVPEGMMAWLLAGAALLLVIRVLGRRVPQ